MKRKIVLSLVLLLSLIIVTVTAYAYGATTVCQRYDVYGIRFNWAYAVIGTPLISNGTYNVYAEVDQPAANSGSFGNNVVIADEGDLGPYSNSGTANAFVGGYDGDGIYQSDTDSDSN